MKNFMINLKGGVVFPVKDGLTLLDAAHQSKVVIPYSCKGGRCSACKCQVIQGETVALREETGLTAEQKSNNWILSCVRVPKSDVVLDIEDLSYFNMPDVRTLPCKIHQIKQLTADVIGVHLRLPPNSDFLYLAGQYVEVIGSDGVKRSYSIANAPASSKLLELQIKRIHGGLMSHYWFENAQVNDLLRIKGPLGTFCLRNVNVKHLIFLATGTGIAPAKAILESLTKDGAAKLPEKISLYWGARQSSNFYWNPKVLKLKVDFKPVLSRERRCTEHYGHVQNALLKDVSQLSDAAVYACGSQDMITDAHKKLVSFGLLDSHFYSDAFVESGTT